jgi:exodeoxyribonuclease VII small subunit
MSEPTPSFEASLEALEACVAELERGELSLDRALELYERGTGLVRACQKTLDDADARIRDLTGSPGEARESDRLPSERHDP